MQNAAVKKAKVKTVKRASKASKVKAVGKSYKAKGLKKGATVKKAAKSDGNSVFAIRLPMDIRKKIDTKGRTAFKEWLIKNIANF